MGQNIGSPESPSNNVPPSAVYNSVGRQLNFKNESFGSSGKEPGELLSPEGITVSKGGEIIVADFRNSRIQIFSSKGKLLRCFGRFGNEEGQFRLVKDVFITKKGHLLVAEWMNHRVQEFKQNGDFVRTIIVGNESGQRRWPHGVCGDHRDGSIYVTHALYSRPSGVDSIITSYDTNGAKLWDIRNDKFRFLDKMSLHEGLLYVTDMDAKCVHILDTTGKPAYLRSIGEGLLQRPRGIAFSRCGCLVVGTPDNITIMSTTGNLIWKLGEDVIGKISGVAVSPITGKILACDVSNNKIHKFSIQRN